MDIRSPSTGEPAVANVKIWHDGHEDILPIEIAIVRIRNGTIPKGALLRSDGASEYCTPKEFLDEATQTAKVMPAVVITQSTRDATRLDRSCADQAEGLRVLGTAAMILGAVIVVFSLWTYQMSASGEKTVNLGLLAGREIGIILGVGSALLGGIIFTAGRLTEIFIQVRKIAAKMEDKKTTE